MIHPMNHPMWNTRNFLQYYYPPYLYLWFFLYAIKVAKMRTSRLTVSDGCLYKTCQITSVLPTLDWKFRKPLSVQEYMTRLYNYTLWYDEGNSLDDWNGKTRYVSLRSMLIRIAFQDHSKSSNRAEWLGSKLDCVLTTMYVFANPTAISGILRSAIVYAVSIRRAKGI